MNTVITLVLVAFMVACVVYLFGDVSDFKGMTNEQGTCSEEDYVIAQQISERH